MFILKVSVRYDLSECKYLVKEQRLLDLSHIGLNHKRMGVPTEDPVSKALADPLLPY